MELFVFVPYEWSYCGGTLGVVANDYDEAISILRDYHEPNPLYSVVCPSGYIEKNKFDYPYAKALFIRQEEKDQAQHDESDQWILEYSVEVDDSNGARIVFDNWNYA